MSIETADVLDRAADIIERNGWHQGGLFNPVGNPPESCPVCVMGAINIASTGRVYTDTSGGFAARNVVADAFADYLGLDHIGGVADWNDAEDRTAEQVITALRAAARAEREAS